MRESCQIQHPNGMHYKYSCREECDRLVREKRLRRLPRAKGVSPRYQMISYPDPSKSRPSPTLPTLSDMEAFAGVRRASVHRIERLIGFGLLPDTALLVPRFL